MELSQIIPHIEALIFASDKPLTSMEIAEFINSALGFIEDRASNDQVDAALDGIREKYNSEFYAFELKQSGGGWQFLTKPEFHKTVALINGDKFIKRLSSAALETLAIIAYKQPITKSEIESIRGVNCDYAVQKLLEKDLVIISGRNENSVGKPLIYSTSKSFMDYFGINSADELPKINEVLMEEMVRATAIGDIDTDAEGFSTEIPAGIPIEQDITRDTMEELTENNMKVDTEEQSESIPAAEIEKRKILVSVIKEEITEEAPKSETKESEL